MDHIKKMHRVNSERGFRAHEPREFLCRVRELGDEAPHYIDHAHTMDRVHPWTRERKAEETRLWEVLDKAEYEGECFNFYVSGWNRCADSNMCDREQDGVYL